VTDSGAKWAEISLIKEMSGFVTESPFIFLLNTDSA
jgi:hypothetical protein